MSNFEDIFTIVSHIARLQKQAVRLAIEIYEPEINDMINSKSNDINRIDHILDALLDFAFDDKVLFLYRKLCRHCLYLNPALTKFYIDSYREIWDREQMRHK